MIFICFLYMTFLMAGFCLTYIYTYVSVLTVFYSSHVCCEAHPTHFDCVYIRVSGNVRDGHTA